MNMQKRHFLSQIWSFLFFQKCKQLDKFEGGDFKYYNICFKILVKNYTKKAFLVPDLGIFVFSQNFVIRQI